jgi:hypothetical protein
MPRAVRLGGNVVSWADDCSSVRTVFPDGGTLDATPNQDPESLRHARELGYGTDTGRMSRDHELAHTFLAVALGLDRSPTLWTTAHPGRPGGAGPEQRAWEEALVFDFQRLLNDPAYDSHTFACLKVLGYGMGGLRGQFLALLR